MEGGREGWNCCCCCCVVGTYKIYICPHMQTRHQLVYAISALLFFSSSFLSFPPYIQRQASSVCCMQQLLTHVSSGGEKSKIETVEGWRTEKRKRRRIMEPWKGEGGKENGSRGREEKGKRERKPTNENENEK